MEKETGAKIGIVSTGPDRDQTLEMPEFREAMQRIAGKISIRKSAGRRAGIQAMISFAVRMKFRSEDRERVAEVLTALAQASRQEPGCVSLYPSHRGWRAR